MSVPKGRTTVGKRVLAGTLAGLLALQLGCGTLFYPERHGQRSGRVDPAVLLFDGALLVLFVVPGLIAFGIDFHTGAVYLPSRSGRVSVVPVPAGELTREGIERIVLEHTGVPVRLSDPSLEARAIAPERGLAAALAAAQARARAGGGGRPAPGA